MITPEQKQQVEAKVRECLNRGNRLYKSKATISKIVYVKKGHTISGRACKNRETGEAWLRLSLHMLEAEFDWMMNEIIPHEVAHIIGFWLDDNGGDGSYDHDDRWSEIAKSLGSTGEPRPQTPSSYDRNNIFKYRSNTGREILVNRQQHDSMQNDFKSLRDNRDGGRINASGFVGPATYGHPEQQKSPH